MNFNESQFEIEACEFEKEINLYVHSHFSFTSLSDIEITSLKISLVDYKNEDISELIKTQLPTIYADIEAQAENEAMSIANININYPELTA